MGTMMKEMTKNDVRLGECAAKQPLSGISVVTKISVKGGNGMSCFVSTEETKRVI